MRTGRRVTPRTNLRTVMHERVAPAGLPLRAPAGANQSAYCPRLPFRVAGYEPKTAHIGRPLLASRLPES